MTLIYHPQNSLTANIVFAWKKFSSSNCYTFTRILVGFTYNNRKFSQICCTEMINQNKLFFKNTKEKIEPMLS